MKIEEMTDPGAFQHLRNEWSELVNLSSEATIFQTCEWQDAWWRYFGQRKQLRILVVRENGCVVGIAPLYVSSHFRTPFRRLAFVGCGVSDYLTPIVANHCAEEVATDLLHYLVDHFHGWDLADLQQIAPDSTWLRMAAEFNRGRQAPPFTTQEMEPCPYLSLTSRWEEVIGKFGKKLRSNIGYYERLLYRTYQDVDLSLHQGGDIGPVMNEMFSLHQRRWRSRWLPGVLGSARTRAFHQLVAGRFAESGWLRLHTLLLDGRVAAALYCFQYRDRYYYYLGGFDPGLARLSLGTVLTAAAIKQAVSESCRTFDFLRGRESYKYRWCSGDRVNRRLIIGGPGMRSRMLYNWLQWEWHLAEQAKAIADHRSADSDKKRRAGSGKTGADVTAVGIGGGHNL